jgi:hypothetical protein
LAAKIEDETLSYQWLIRPIEKKISKTDYQIVSLEVYNEDSTLQLVGNVEFEKVKTQICQENNYFMNYAEALKQKLFVSDLQVAMSTPARKEKASRLFKKQMISDLNMREEENKMLSKPNNEFVKYLIEAVQKKEISAYLNDSLQTKLSTTEFDFNFSMPQLINEEDSTLNTPSQKWEVKQLYKLNMVEEIRFDQWGKRKSYQPQAISVILPAQENIAKGIDEPLAYFSYKEVLKLLKRKKQTEMVNGFEQRIFKTIPLFMKASTY